MWLFTSEKIHRRARYGTFQEASGPNQAGERQTGHVGGHGGEQQNERATNGNSQCNCINRQCFLKSARMASDSEDWGLMG
jgi:hypothetical protein